MRYLQKVDKLITQPLKGWQVPLFIVGLLLVIVFVGFPLFRGLDWLLYQLFLQPWGGEVFLLLFLACLGVYIVHIRRTSG